MIGQRLGHYRIVEKISEGGMGVVYRAHDEQLDRKVALKVLPPGALADEAARKRFRKEALALAKLNHPNIEAVHEFGTQDGVDFLVMEYIPGMTLAERLAVGALPEKEVLTLGEHIAAALEEAHEQGVVHRDLKPGNIVVTPKGQAKVLDFGLAKLLRPESEISTADVLSSTVAVAGTLPYMSPEQLRGKDADARGDIYAAGAVLYEMATGKRPFQEKVASALADDILHKPPPPPGRLKHDLSPRLEEIILKCLEKDPESRYQSSKELGVDLRRLSGASMAVAAWPAIPARISWRMWLAIGGVVMLMAALVGFNVATWRERLLSQASPGRVKSLAVLPLENLSRDPEQEYFADGMTEALITELAQISALRVISRTSVVQYKGTMKTLPQIAKELRVDAVLEGSVQRSDDKVGIMVQLIHAPTDRHMWAKPYERELRDVLTLEREVARTIAREIQVKLTSQEQARLSTARAVNPEAYDAYLKGRFFWNKRTPEGFYKALDFFQQAIKKDTGYAQPYSGLADSYTLLQDYGLLLPKDAYPRAKAAALRAIELDETLAEAHTSLAAVLEDYDWDWAGAEREYKRAIELDSNYETAHQWYGALLSTLGRHGEALAQAKTARDLAPVSARINIDVAWALYWTRLYDEARDESRNTLELDPNFAPAYTLLGWASVRKNLLEEAIAEFEKAIDLSGDRTANQVGIAYARAMAGQRVEALRILDELKNRPKPASVPSYQMAVIYVGLGEKERALESLEKAYEEEHDKWLGFVKVDPSFDPLNSEPRFKRLLARMNFPG